MVKGDSRLEQEELFQSIADTITATLNLPTCIWVFDEKAQALRIAGAVGLRPAYVKRAVLKLDEPSVHAVVLQTGQPLAVCNVLEDERWKYRREAENRGWKSALCVPIKVTDRTLGVISIYTIVEREFSPPEQELLERYAALIGTSLENERRAEALTRLSEVGRSLVSIQDSPRALDRVLKQIAQNARKVLGADMVDLYQYIQDRDEFVVPPILIGKRQHSHVPRVKVYDDGVVMKIVREIEPRYFPQAQEDPLLTGPFKVPREDAPEQRFVIREGVESSAAIPLKAGEEIVGVMFVSYRTSQSFTAEQREQIELFANQAAVALHNARLFQQERQRAEAMDLLRKVSVELSTTLDVERVLDLIVAGAMRLTGMESGVIYLIDETGQAVMRSFEHPKGFQHPPPRLSKKAGLTRHIIETGEVLVFPDVSKDERVNPAALEKGVKSMIALPLKIGEKVVGVLFLNDLQPRKFTEDEHLLLSTLADQAALAIRNARLFESEKRRLETLTTLHSVGRSLVSELDLSQVLEEIAQSAFKVLEADIITLYQYFEDEDKFETPPAMTGSFRNEKPMRDKIYPDDIVVRIVRDGESHFAEDVWEDSLLSDPRTDGFGRPRFVEREGIKSSAGVLLKVENEVVGVMFVSYRRPITFGSEVRYRIEIFANQAALAIRNARLYQSLERKVEELEETQEKLIASERLAALGTATAALQHRVSNTLNLVNPGIMRLRRRIDPNDKDAAETLDIMERNVHYTSQIISRLQEPLKEEIASVTDVNSHLREIVQDVRERESEMCQKVTFNLDGLNPGIPRIEIGTRQLTEVFRNLVENACKAMQPQGGTLTLSSRLVDSTIEVEFQDTGPGISPHVRDRLFTRPVPPKDFEAGTGLGLWLSKLILQKYGGDIKVKDTRPGLGTSMLIRLPAIQQPTIQQAESEGVP